MTIIDDSPLIDFVQMEGAVYCPRCLYDLSRTQLPRCPECGGAFDRRKPDTYLQTASTWAALEFQFSRLIRNGVDGMFGGERTYCRECYGSLEGAVSDKCPTCGKWFRYGDRSTYRKSDCTFVRLFYRFRDVCVWRGVLLPIPLLIYASYCILTRTAFLPAGGMVGASSQTLDLTGWPAVAMGTAWLGIPVALHSRYFWGRVEPAWRFADLGLVFGILMIVGGWGSALVWAIGTTMR